MIKIRTVVTGEWRGETGGGMTGNGSRQIMGASEDNDNKCVCG